MTERPILRTSQSSPGNSPGPSPSLRPSIIHQSSYGSPPPPVEREREPTSPLGIGLPVTAPTGTSSNQPRVSFPWEPTRKSSTDHLAMNQAGLHSSFAHRPESVLTDGGDSTTNTLVATDSNTTAVQAQNTGYSHARRASGGTGTATGYGMPKTRTSSTGATGTIGPEFGYTRKVGFETFDNPEKNAALFSYTLQAKSDAYRRTRNTRVFMVAVSPDESGSEALEWLMESLIEDGDEIVAVRVIELDEGEKASKDAQDEFREEAGGLLRKVLELNDEVSDRRISVIVEFVAGRVSSTLMRLISLYRPDSLIVGTKGSRSTLQKFGAALGAPGMGSVSRYCVSHSPVPVIVVRPERKVKKTLAKRQNDPKRQKYKAMVGSEALGLRRSRSAESRERGGALSE